MANYDALHQEIAKLRARVEELEEELRQERENSTVPALSLVRQELKLPRWAEPMLKLLCSRLFVAKSSAVVIAEEWNWATAGHYPTMAICQIRKAVRPHGIEIKTLWGRGWTISVESQAKLRALIADAETAYNLGVKDAA